MLAGLPGRGGEIRIRDGNLDLGVLCASADLHSSMQVLTEYCSVDY